MGSSENGLNENRPSEMVRLKIGQVKKSFENGSDENVLGENGWGKNLK